MRWLLDTNVLLRLADVDTPQHVMAEAAIERLVARAESVFVCMQVLVEFWAVATRPESANGLGWSTSTTVEAIRTLRDQFPLLNETPEVLTAGSNWLLIFRSPASTLTMRAWRRCCWCTELVGC
jgi:predicted nucleic acid-binding protein